MPRKMRSAKETAKSLKALKFVKEGRVVDRSRYHTIKHGRTVLEAIYRIQEARESHKCDKADCPLGGEILPMMDYARVYYEDEDVVERFHKACFKEEFIDA